MVKVELVFLPPEHDTVLEHVFLSSHMPLSHVLAPDSSGERALTLEMAHKRCVLPLAYIVLKEYIVSISFPTTHPAVSSG